jgi:hypothetical protein
MVSFPLAIFLWLPSSNIIFVLIFLNIMGLADFSLSSLLSSFLVLIFGLWLCIPSHALFSGSFKDELPYILQLY